MVFEVRLPLFHASALVFHPPRDSDAAHDEPEKATRTTTDAPHMMVEVVAMELWPGSIGLLSSLGVWVGIRGVVVGDAVMMMPMREHAT